MSGRRLHEELHRLDEAIAATVADRDRAAAAMRDAVEQEQQARS